MSNGRTTPDWKHERPKNQPRNIGGGPLPQPPPANGESAPKADPKADWSPKPKVAAAAVTVPFSGLVIYVAEQFGLEVPPHVAGEVAVLVALAVAYLVPDRS